MSAEIVAFPREQQVKNISGPITTPLTRYFGVKHPICLAGMNIAAGPRLAAAVSNAGGLPCLGGNGYPKAVEYDTLEYEAFLDFFAQQTPEKVRLQIKQMKAEMNDPNAPFGVDILLPQVGGSAKKVNHDYTIGTFDKIIDVVIEEKAAFFVSALGAAPKHQVDKLHAAGILVANMCGHPKQLKRALDSGADMIIAQGTEGGGHSGDVATSILTPTIVQMCKGRKSAFTGQDIIVLCAGGIFNGKGLAAALMYGADGVWVGTRFIATPESGASNGHQDAVLKASFSDTVRSSIFTGRPMRVFKHPLVNDWQMNRKSEIKALTDKGILPLTHEVRNYAKHGKVIDATMDRQLRPILIGQVSGVIDSIRPAREIVEEMVDEAVDALLQSNKILSKL